MTLVLAAVTAVGMSGVTTFALNAIVAGVVPVACSHAVQRAIARRLPAHLFVYLFGSGFFNAALATAASAVAAVALLYGSGAYDWQRLADDYLPYALLAAFPEAFVTGAGISYFVVYHPGWVVSFREEWYLER
jgi:uncharacterized membrane protein